MDFELDLFDDKPTTTNAPAGGRFKPNVKPKAKALPRKGPSASVPSALPSVPKKKIDTQASTSSDPTKSKENVNVVENTSSGVQITTSESNRTNEPLTAKTVLFSGVQAKDENIDSVLLNFTPEHVANGENVGCADNPFSEGARPGSNGDLCSSLGKLDEENAGINSGLEYHDDVLSQSAAPVGNSQHVVGEIAQPGIAFAVSFPVSPGAKNSKPSGDAQTLTGSIFKLEEGETDISVVSPVDALAFGPTDTFPNPPIAEGLVSCMETNLSNNDVEFEVDYGSLEAQEVEAFPSLDYLETVSNPSLASGGHIGKFLPKPKVQHGEKDSATNISTPYAVESRSSWQDSQLVPPECENTDGSTVSAFVLDNVLDLSHVGSHDPHPTVPTLQLPFSEEPTNPADTAIPVNNAYTGAVSGVNGELSDMRRKGKSSSGSDLPEKAYKFSAVNEDKSGESSRQLRKRVAAHKLVDESANDVHDSGDFHAENPSGSVRNEGDDEHRVEATSMKKPSSKKSKKPVAQNEKTVRKRKKATEVQEEVAKVIPKKFSHSTRRKIRRVDKVLLETPEEELDRTNIPLKDLILLAEYNERLVNKEAATLKIPSTNQRSGENFATNASNNEDPPYNLEDDFASEQGRGSFHGEETPVVQEASRYFNYHTHMDKVPKSRWSKQHTELFYEGVRQFGSDISMIQQLFPDRTRRQVLLKFKKEERQHPSRLDDALRNRSKDHSQFEKVIELLQQVAAQQKLNSNEDGLTDITNEEEMEEAVSPKTMGEDGSVHPQEELAEPEKGEEELVRDPEEVAADGSESPVKSHDSDDDFSRWCQYNSDI